VLPLEREGRAFRVVLVVGTSLARGLGDPGELPVQGRGQAAHAGALRQQQFAGSRHPSDFRTSPMSQPAAPRKDAGLLRFL
jgi:hypothetical protein